MIKYHLENNWMKNDSLKKTTVEIVDLYELIEPLLRVMHQDFQELTKKKPEAILSINKVEVVNRILKSCRKVLDGESSLQFLDLIDSDKIPQNSDVLLMLSQYVAAMRQFRSKYYVHNGISYEWSIENLLP
jgi:hypothetical protein